MNPTLSQHLLKTRLDKVCLKAARLVKRCNGLSRAHAADPRRDWTRTLLSEFAVLAVGLDAIVGHATSALNLLEKGGCQ